MELDKLNSGLSSKPVLQKGPEKTNNRSYAIFALIVFLIVVGLIYLAVQVFKNKPKLTQNNDYVFWSNSISAFPNSGLVSSSTPEEQAIFPIIKTIVKKTAVIKKPATTIKTPSTSLFASSDYLKARNTYQTSGYYFQFLNCHGSPGSLVVKKGAKLMLDNRDNKTRKIVFLDRLYNIGAYNYVIVTADKLGKFYITCDGGGAAQINVVP